MKVSESLTSAVKAKEVYLSDEEYSRIFNYTKILPELQQIQQ